MTRLTQLPCEADSRSCSLLILASGCSKARGEILDCEPAAPTAAMAATSESAGQEDFLTARPLETLRHHLRPGISGAHLGARGHRYRRSSGRLRLERLKCCAVGILQSRVAQGQCLDAALCKVDRWRSWTQCRGRQPAESADGTEGSRTKAHLSIDCVTAASGSSGSSD